MTEIVTEEKFITKYQNQFVRELKKVCNIKISGNLGYQGNSHDLTVYYSDKYNFWFASSKSNNRFWNAFGPGRPLVNRSNSITVEINFPFQGVNRNIGGAFAIEKNGQVLIVHRGKIGGGRIGIGQKLFFDNYREEPIIANDSGVENVFCFIGELNSKYLPKQIGNFVSEVHRIKKLSPKEANHFSFLNNFSFTDEPAGPTKIKRSGITIINRTHGIVVNTLARILESKGNKIAKDINRDLFIHNRGKVTHLFEIKRSSSAQSLHSAVGQLLVYSIPIKEKVELILVLPEKLNKVVEKKLNELGMKVLYYDWNDGDPVFNNLGRFF